MGKHRKGDSSNRGNGGKMPEPDVRYRVEYHDEDGKFASVVLGSAVACDEFTKDLNGRNLRYRVFAL